MLSVDASALPAEHLGPDHQSQIGLAIILATGVATGVATGWSGRN